MGDALIGRNIKRYGLRPLQPSTACGMCLHHRLISATVAHTLFVQTFHFEFDHAM